MKTTVFERLESCDIQAESYLHELKEKLEKSKGIGAESLCNEIRDEINIAQSKCKVPLRPLTDEEILALKFVILDGAVRANEKPGRYNPEDYKFSPNMLSYVKYRGYGGDWFIDSSSLKKYAKSEHDGSLPTLEALEAVQEFKTLADSRGVAYNLEVWYPSIQYRDPVVVARLKPDLYYFVTMWGEKATTVSEAVEYLRQWRFNFNTEKERERRRMVIFQRTLGSILALAVAMIVGVIAYATFY